MIKTFLLHHKDFKERFDLITSNLNKQSIEYRLVDNFHPDDIDYDSLMNGYDVFENITIEQINNHSYVNFSKKISIGSLSLILKHLESWKIQVENDYDKILIIEDDCEIVENFSEFINDILKELDNIHNNNLDLIMIGTSHEFISPNFNNTLQKVFYHPLQKTRCTHCYVITKECAKKMIDGFQRFNLPIDFKMNEVIQLNSLKVGWVEPGLKQI
jgi:GR25 family glycosyltransferase involved in LPS biosynthesis